MVAKILMYIGLAKLVLYPFQSLFLVQGDGENSPPVVVITKPFKNTVLPWNSIVPYSIHVNDREDGNSEYDEIQSGQVLLLVNYFPKSSDAKNYLEQGLDRMPDPLIQMSKSTCLICHMSKSKLIGPSFDLIATRYGKNPSQVDALAQKVISGSKGIWGELIMPPHPDLEIGQVKKMVNWILENGANSNQSFYTGTEGVFRTIERPTGQTGVYVLTASYTDQGRDDIPKSNKQGKHSLEFKPN